MTPPVDSSNEGDYCSIAEAMKIVGQPFDGNKSKLREFLDNVDVVFDLVNPSQHERLLKFVKARITGEARSKLIVRDRTHTWAQVKAILEENYSVRRTLDFYACAMFSAKQRKGESVAAWGSRIDCMQTELRDAARRVSSEDEEVGAIALVNHLAKACFVQGLENDRIQTIVRSKGEALLLPAAVEVALEEESAILSAIERGRAQNPRNPIKCENCGKLGHPSAKCYLKRIREEPKGVRALSGLNCFRCGRMGHLARDCLSARGPISGQGRGSPRVGPGDRKWERRGNNPAPPHAEVKKVNTVRREGTDTITLGVGSSRTGYVRFLVDTGADVSLIKASVLKKGTKYSLQERVALQGVTEEIVKALGTLDLKLETENKERMHKFHLVDESFSLRCDGILGKDFWSSTGAKINYEKGEIAMGNVVVPFDSRTDTPKKERVWLLKLPARSETIVRCPTECDGEGIIEKGEISPGVFLAESLTYSKQRECVTSVVNTNDEEKIIESPVVKLIKLSDEEMNKESSAECKVESELRRKELLYSLLRLSHLNKEESREIRAILDEYRDLFYLPGDTLSCTSSAVHCIPTPTLDPTQSIRVKPYRLPEAHKEEVRIQTEKMLAEGIISPSKSGWNSPILVIPKKADASGRKKWRIVVDFRKLNDVTVGDAFPLPNITEILDQLGKARYFSTLDLASGFQQIPLREEDKEKTAFSNHLGHFHYNTMPFGLKGAPSTFQRLMNTVLTGLQGIKCFVYLDDIVVHGDSLSTHNYKLKEILERLREHNLKLHPDKCEFLRREVTYLGHIITEDGVKPDPKKVEKVQDFPKPKTTKELKGFLGLAGYYRRFIPQFSSIASPLHALLKKNVPYEWGAKQQEAFERLKEILTTEPILQFPDFSQKFILTTDASNEALGCVLSQGQIGKDLPIAYASRTLNKAEKSYSTIEKELLSIVHFVKYFRPYLYGRKFLIVTDHRPLTWIFNVKDPSSRLLRWRIKLEEYDYEVAYKRGKLNSNADALSRIYAVESQNSQEDGENEKEKEEEEEDDEEEDDEAAEEDDDWEEDKENDRSEGKEIQNISNDRKEQIFREFHDSPVGGHQGMKRTLERIKLYVRWPGMKEDVEKYIRRCETCQKNKLTRKKVRMPMEITTTPDVVFQKCCMDVVGPLPVTHRGNRYLLTFQDELSKFTIAVPIEKQDAVTIAKVFVENMVLKFGVPQTLLTDQGANFLSEMFRNTCKLLKIKKMQTTAFHPQSNGALERSHRTLTEYLRHFIAEDQSNWDEWIVYAIFVFNTTPHTATRLTPHELMFGRKANIPGCLQMRPKEVNYSTDDYLAELKSRLQSCYVRARENLLDGKAKNKKTYDRKSNLEIFKEGDKVLLFDESVRRGRSKKLSAQWIGPYEVLASEGVNVLIKKKNKVSKVHANRLKPFFL